MSQGGAYNQPITSGSAGRLNWCASFLIQDSTYEGRGCSGAGGRAGCATASHVLPMSQVVRSHQRCIIYITRESTHASTLGFHQTISLMMFLKTENETTMDHRYVLYKDFGLLKPGEPFF